MRFSNETQKDVICEQSKNYARISLFPCLFREKMASVCVYVFLHLTPTAFTEYDESFLPFSTFLCALLRKFEKYAANRKMYVYIHFLMQSIRTKTNHQCRHNEIIMSEAGKEGKKHVTGSDAKGMAWQTIYSNYRFHQRYEICHFSV